MGSVLFLPLQAGKLKKENYEKIHPAFLSALRGAPDEIRSMQKNLLRKIKRRLLFPAGFSLCLVLIIFVYTKKADFHQPIISCIFYFLCFVNFAYTSIVNSQELIQSCYLSLAFRFSFGFFLQNKPVYRIILRSFVRF